MFRYAEINRIIQGRANGLKLAFLFISRTTVNSEKIVLVNMIYNMLLLVWILIREWSTYPMYIVFSTFNINFLAPVHLIINITVLCILGIQWITITKNARNSLTLASGSSFKIVPEFYFVYLHGKSCATERPILMISFLVTDSSERY